MAYQDDWEEITSDPRWASLPEHKRNALTRKFARVVVAPEVGGGKAPQLRSFLQENVLGKAPQARQGSIWEGAKQQADNTLTGLAARGVKKALTGDGGRFVQEDSAIAPGLGSILKEAAGASLADLIDPAGLAIDAVTGRVGSKLVKSAVKGSTKAATIIGTGAVSGGIQGGGSAALQGNINGKIDPAQVAKNAGLGAVLGGAIPTLSALRGMTKTPAPVIKQSAPSSAPKAAPLALPPTPQEATLRARGLNPQQVARVMREQAAMAPGPAIEMSPIRAEIPGQWIGGPIDVPAATTRTTPATIPAAADPSANLSFLKLLQDAQAPNAAERDLIKAAMKKHAGAGDPMDALRLQLGETPSLVDVTDPLQVMQLQLAPEPPARRSPPPVVDPADLPAFDLERGPASSIRTNRVVPIPKQAKYNDKLRANLETMYPGVIQGGSVPMGEMTSRGPSGGYGYQLDFTKQPAPAPVAPAPKLAMQAIAEGSQIPVKTVAPAPVKPKAKKNNLGTIGNKDIARYDFTEIGRRLDQERESLLGELEVYQHAPDPQGEAMAKNAIQAIETWIGTHGSAGAERGSYQKAINAAEDAAQAIEAFKHYNSPGETAGAVSYNTGDANQQGVNYGQSRLAEPTGAADHLFNPRGEDGAFRQHGTGSRSVQGVQIGSYLTGTTKIRDAGDVAHLAQELKDKAQENLVAVVTDKGGNVLYVLPHTAGGISDTSAYPSLIVGNALRTPDAAKVYLVHNHPSGNANLSSADRSMLARAQNIADGSGIEVVDLLAIGSGGKYASRTRANEAIPALDRNQSVPVVERRITGEAGSYRLSRPEDAISLAPKIAPDGGIILLDTQNRVVRVLPFPEGTGGLASLRGEAQREMLKGLEGSNAGGMVIYSKEPIDDVGLENLHRFGNAISDAVSRDDWHTPIIDVIGPEGSYRQTYVNQGKQWWDPDRGSYFYSNPMFDPRYLASGVRHLGAGAKMAGEAIGKGAQKAQEKLGDATLAAVAGQVKDIRFNAPEPQAAGTRPRVNADAVRMLGEDARNLKGAAAQAVNEMAATKQTRRPASPDEVAAVNAGEFMNLGKFDISKEERANLERIIRESVAETGGNPKKVVTFEDIKAEAAKIDPAIVSALKAPKDGMTLHPAVRQAARDRLNALNSEAFKLRKQAAQGENTMLPDERARLSEMADRLEKDAKGLIDVLYPTRSQDGRNLAYHRMMASNSFDADYWMSRARRAAGGALKDEQHTKLSDIIARGDEATKAGDAAGARRARIDLAIELTKLERSSKTDVAISLWKAGLLTGIKTQGRNLLGNVGFGVLEEISRMPSSIADLALSMATKNRTVGGVSMDAVARSSYEAATRGIAEAGQVMRHGATEDQLARFNLGRELNSGNKLIDTYVNTVFRTLSATDRVFKSYAYRRSLEEQAMLMAKTKGGKDVKAIARKLADAPTPAMEAQAIADAEFATFNNRNKVADAIGAGKRMLKTKSELAAAGVDVVMPFTNTPMNVIARVLDYAGVGAAAQTPQAALKLLKQAMTPEEQRAYSQALGRGATGITVILMGYKLAQEGLMTGTYQSDQKERGLNEAANRPSGAIKIGGQWHQVGSLSPWGNLLTIGATLHRDGSDLPSVASIGLKTAFDQPFMQGLSGVTDLIKDPGKEAPKFVADLAGSTVPTLVGDVAGAFDDKQRESDTIIEGMQKKIPGLRNALPAKQDPMGREIESSPLNAVNPFLSREAREETDPIVAELVRLGHGITKPQETITIKGEKRKLDDGQHRELVKMTGDKERELLAKLLKAPRYKRADDDQKRELIDRVISRSRELARNKYKRKAV